MNRPCIKMNSYTRKIYYHDTDCGGVVYYGNYLKFLEEARTDALEQIGLSVKKLADEDILFVVRRQEIDYDAPAQYGDVLDIKTWFSKIGKASVEFEYEVIRDGKIITKAKTTMVCVDSKIKAKPIPQDIREKFAKLSR